MMFGWRRIEAVKRKNDGSLEEEEGEEEMQNGEMFGEKRV